MRNYRKDPVKSQLPHPYDQDLSKILRGLSRDPATYHGTLANDPLTASFVRAAISLIQQYLGPRDEDRGATGARGSVKLLSFLSQREVAKKVGDNPKPFPRTATHKQLRNRWDPHSNFIADVLRFCLWSWHYPAAQLDETANARNEMLRGPDPVHGLHELCDWDLTKILATPMFRLSLVAAAAAEGDEVIREAASERYRKNNPLWQQFYEEFLRERELRLRSGITLDDCADLLLATADGLAMRALADPGADVVKRRLLAKAALLLIAGCVERVDQAGSLSLEETVRAMMSEPSGSTQNQA
jgi:hypothetical protein